MTVRVDTSRHVFFNYFLSTAILIYDGLVKPDMHITIFERAIKFFKDFGVNDNKVSQEGFRKT